MGVWFLERLGLCRNNSQRPEQCSEAEKVLRWLLAEKTWLLHSVADIIIDSKGEHHGAADEG